MIGHFIEAFAHDTLNGSFFEELASRIPNLWNDEYFGDSPATFTEYDHYIDHIQDKIIYNNPGMTHERQAIMREVDYWQHMLRHPELRTNLVAFPGQKPMDDAGIKQHIADLLGIGG